MVAKSGLKSPRSFGSIYLKFVLSMTITLGSFRKDQSNWLYPTSMAHTLAAPFFRAQSVNPPVEAPISSILAPFKSMEKAWIAFSSFSPPRLT
ncbi:hypothetical protein D3C73_1445970 [compost metagenome]